MKERFSRMRRDFFGVKHVLVKRFCFRFVCLWDCETMEGQDCISSNLPRAGDETARKYFARDESESARTMRAMNKKEQVV